MPRGLPREPKGSRACPGVLIPFYFWRTLTIKKRCTVETVEQEKRMLFIQPFDRPWMNPKFSAGRKNSLPPRAVFEVGQWIPLEYAFAFLDVNLRSKQEPTWSIQQIVAEKVREFQPDLILLAFPTFAQGAQVKEIILTAKEVSPAVKIILGGATLNLIKDAPRRRWDWPVDACYWGNGAGIAELIEEVLVAEPGCFLTKSDPVGLLIDDYEPEAFYTLNGRFNYEGYLAETRSAGLNPGAVVELVRGCDRRCNYCAFGLNSVTKKSRKPATVLAEFYYLAEKGIDYILIIDPTFGLAGGETKELLSGMTVFHTKHPEVQFDVMTSSGHLTEEFARKLKKAGCERCGLGMETMSQSGLYSLAKASGPASGPEMVRKAVQNLTKAGVQIRLFQMLIPGEFATDTIAFFLELAEKKVDFLVQSSFKRDLPGAESQEIFWIQDRTVFNPASDTIEQLMEYLLINIAFPSMDLTFEDLKLREAIKQAIAEKRPLGSLFSQSHSEGRIVLSIVGGYTFTESVTHGPMWSCIKKEEL
jgi:hypothetical protein